MGVSYPVYDYYRQGQGHKKPFVIKAWTSISQLIDYDIKVSHMVVGQ